MAHVSVTGASGLLGTNLVLALVDAGHTVAALARNSASVQHLQQHAAATRIRFVGGDLDDAAALNDAFGGAEVVFHVAARVSILPRVTAAMTRVNVDGTANVVDAVRRVGSTRLVHTSSTVCIGLATIGGPDADETTRFNLAEARLTDGYSITKKRAEDVVAAANDVDRVIVNPGFMFGPWDSKPSSGKLIVDLVLGKVPATTLGVNSFVDVRDVARGMIAAWQHGRSGERYILGGHNLSYQAMMHMVAERAGVRAPTRVLPRPLALAAGMVGDVQAALTGNEPGLTSAAVRWSYCDRFRVSCAKAQRELGYRRSPLPGAIDASIAWFKSNGRLPA